MMKNKKFIDKIVHRTAQVAVGSSALRNQGKAGVIADCRAYFLEIELLEFRKELDSSTYLDFLDDHTEKLKTKINLAVNLGWGTARKALNLFLRDVVYNSYLADHLDIPIAAKENRELLKQMEVPLDNDVASQLKKQDKTLPKWPRIKYLKKADSTKFQVTALKIANQEEIARVHLDLLYWRK